MADLQKQFDDFHSEIRLGNKDEKAKLQDKRDLLVKNLSDGLKKKADNGGKKYTFGSFNQGSYAMHTGTKPLDNDYDIDVGIIFDNSKNDFNNALELKKIVRDAISSNFRTVNIRRPCVTTTYLKDGNPDYHVDLAIYVKKPFSDSYYIAMGKEHSSEENIEWVDSDPKGLTAKINNCHSDDDRKQFRRVIRFMKRWRDNSFSKSNEAPISIALTCSAYHWFVPKKSAGSYNDLRATLSLVQSMLDNYGIFSGRLAVSLPVIPYNDLFEGLTNKQMYSFKEKLENFRDTLKSSLENNSVKDASEQLIKCFGAEFPEGLDTEDSSDDSLESFKHPVVTTGSSA
jgi:predicted nucleotidyltransferase